MPAIIAATHRDIESLVESGKFSRGPLLSHQRGAMSDCRRCGRGGGDVLQLAQIFLDTYAVKPLNR